jgi:hypothetical protein
VKGLLLVIVLGSVCANTSCTNDTSSSGPSIFGTPSIAGTWSQNTNGTFCCTVVYAGAGGSKTQGTSNATNGATVVNQGTWTSSGNAVTTRWTSSIDSLTLSGDGDSYEGSNNEGVVVTGQRTSAGVAGPDSPHAAVDPFAGVWDGADVTYTAACVAETQSCPVGPGSVQPVSFRFGGTLTFSRTATGQLVWNDSDRAVPLTVAGTSASEANYRYVDGSGDTFVYPIVQLSTTDGQTGSVEITRVQTAPGGTYGTQQTWNGPVTRLAPDAGSP